MKTLIHHLLGETRTAILAALLLRPERPLHLRELVRMTGISPGTLHRELRALVAHGVLKRMEVGRQVFHQADPACEVLPELTGLIRKTAGLADALRAALAPLQAEIEVAFVYGSMARGDVHPHSDIDLMIVGNLSFSEAVIALEPAARTLGRDMSASRNCCSNCATCEAASSSHRMRPFAPGRGRSAVRRSSPSRYQRNER